MKLFRLIDPFQIVDGMTIAVGAPHHGTRPNVGADLATGPIAKLLAERLAARVVVVNDLRSTADVNKNPLRLPRDVRKYALRYQNELFRYLPVLVIEVHGHVSGQYDIEITSGFDLDPLSPGDAMFLDHLTRLKRALPGILAGKLGWTPSLGIYPLDRDVKKTATDTYTFQKIRRARNLGGMECYGLHIELNAELRLGSSARVAPAPPVLADALAQSILCAFDPLPLPGAKIPRSADWGDDGCNLDHSIFLHLAVAPASVSGEKMTLLHPVDMEKLDAIDGDMVRLCHGNEQLRLFVYSSLQVQPGQAALSSRLRRQISAEKRAGVAIQRDHAIPGAQKTRKNDLNLIAADVRSARGLRAWLSPSDVAHVFSLGVGSSGHWNAYGQSGQPHAGPLTLVADPLLDPGRTALSSKLAEKLMITIGDVIRLEEAHAAQ